MIDADRALRAFEDVVAVEWDTDSGIMRIVTIGDVYTAIPKEGLHLCPDREYNLDGTGFCKHIFAAEISRGRLDVPSGWLITEDLDKRPTSDADVDTGRAVATDGGSTTQTMADYLDRERPDGCTCTPEMESLPCVSCHGAGFETPNPDVGTEVSA